ncbi:sensor histidine kinase [Actinosynnema sp. NPDC020468]|uniref:sensor histidine kinase n=1 Tax=Actinosynnema sp. NPDC020468 TaxID=3154488 RepID=UPI003403F51A
MKTLLRSCGRAWLYLVVGLGTAIVALVTTFVLVALLAFCAVGVGIPSLPYAVRVVRWQAGFERRRAARASNTPIPEPYRSGSVLKDPATRRDLAWLATHGVTGLLFGTIALGLPGDGLQLLVMAAVWRLAPGGVQTPVALVVDSVPTAWAAALIGVCFLVLSLWLPTIARWQVGIAKALLAAPEGAVLTDRVAELSASRAAALEAHGAELSRIERDLHDGAQARIAAVVMQLGIADQLHERDPETSLSLIRKAQDTATDALAELREVVRGIYPPLLSDRGLDGAVEALAAYSAVPCELHRANIGRRPAAVEAAAYFVVAEMLTNVTKHAEASRVSVTLAGTADTLSIVVEDDGRGGADERRGSGLAGIRRRVAAFDGTMTLTSPPGGPTVLRVELPCGS